MIINNKNHKKSSVFFHYLNKSEKAIQRKIDNDCNIYQINFATKLWHNLFHNLALKFEFQCTINSFYRCLALNLAVGGVNNSYHVNAAALDLNVRLMKNQLEIYEYLISLDIFEEVFYYKLSGFIHVAYIEGSKKRDFAINNK